MRKHTSSDWSRVTKPRSPRKKPRNSRWWLSCGRSGCFSIGKALKSWKVRAPKARLVLRRLRPCRPRQPSATLLTILPLLDPRSARESMQNTMLLPCMSYSARSRPSSRARASRLLSPQPVRNKLLVSGYIPRKTSERGNVRGRVEDAKGGWGESADSFPARGYALRAYKNLSEFVLTRG